MIQIWVLPDEPGEPAGYRIYSPKVGERLQVYGGDRNPDVRFYSKTPIDIAHIFVPVVLSASVSNSLSTKPLSR